MWQYHLKQILKYSHINMMFLLLGLAIFVIPLTYFTGNSYAIGSDYFSITSGSNNYPRGQSFNVEISETSSDNVNAESAVLNYPASLLTLNSITLNGPFTLCGDDSGSGGSINISCAIPDNSVTGTKQVADLKFTATATGVSTIDFINGTAISNTSQENSWNGAYPSANYTIYQPAPPPSTPPATVNNSTSSSTSNTTHYTTFPSAPTSTTSPTTQTAYINNTQVTILVEDQNNKYINGARVTIFGYKSELTNNQGQVVFNKVSIGMHNISVSYPGAKALSREYKIMPNSSAQKIIITLDLLSNDQTRLVAYIVSFIVILSILGALIIHYLKNIKRSQKPISPVDINAGQLATTVPQPIVNNNLKPTHQLNYQPQIIRPTNLTTAQEPLNVSTNNTFSSNQQSINKINNEYKPPQTVLQNTPLASSNMNMFSSKPKTYVIDQPQATQSTISNNSTSTYVNNNINQDQTKLNP